MAGQTTIKKIAKAVKLGMDIHEDSWNNHMDRYDKDHTESFVEAFQSFGLDTRFAELIDLANYWCNDLDNWARAIIGELSPEEVEIKRPMSTRPHDERHG